jgi:hypothetical protein
MAAMSRKPATKQLVKRVDRVKADLEKGHAFAFEKMHKVLTDLGFGANYAELAATDIADDYMNALCEGEYPEVPIWHEDSDEEEEEEDDEEEEEEEEEEELE